MPYSSLHIIFAGDFWQLKLVGNKKPIYEESCPEFTEWVYCFIKLDGMHRFWFDLQWGHILHRFCIGKCTEEDIDLINECVVTLHTKLLKNIRYATYFNQDHDSINAALFEEHCKQLYACRERQHIRHNYDFQWWSNGWEWLQSVCTFQELLHFLGRLQWGWHQDHSTAETLLLLSSDAAMQQECWRWTSKWDPSNIRESCVKTKWVNSNSFDQWQHTCKCSSCKSSSVTLQWSSPASSILQMVPKQYSLLQCQNQRATEKCWKWKQGKYLSLSTLPLQGTNSKKVALTTCLCMIGVMSPTGHSYVMLSCVKTREGLFCRKKLSKDLCKYAVPEALKAMLRQFQCLSPHYFTDKEYDDLLHEWMGRYGHAKCTTATILTIKHCFV